MTEVNVFTRRMEPLFSYETETVPREGDNITRGDAHYRVKTVTYELGDEPSVQLRVEFINDGH